MTFNLPQLRQRVLQISFENRLSHIGSVLTALPIICEIYSRDPERFVLSCGHAGLALYVVLEALGRGDAEEMLHRHGIHPNRNEADGIWASTGSLGMGITVAVGMALAGKDTHCLISDGESFEGSVAEALRFKTTHSLRNLHVYVNMNGFSALDAVNEPYLRRVLEALDPTIQIYQTEPGLPFLKGLAAHYAVMDSKQYQEAIGNAKLQYA